MPDLAFLNLLFNLQNTANHILRNCKACSKIIQCSFLKLQANNCILIQVSEKAKDFCWFEREVHPKS